MAMFVGHEPLAQFQQELEGRYRIEREVGRGAAAHVFLAFDVKHHRKVAFKILRPELTVGIAGVRFLREVRLTAALQHPHIVPLYDSGEAAGLYYFVMPYIEGETLRARMKREGALSVDEALAIVRPLAAALDYLHGKRFVHRDVKPENILFQAGQPVLGDLGIAVATMMAGENDPRVRSGQTPGSPMYMSPEQITGGTSVGPRCDVYALGAVTYEMLAGQPPISGSTLSSLIAHILLEEPRPLTDLRPSVPGSAVNAVHKALAKSPDARFASAGEFADALAAHSGTLSHRVQRRTMVTAASLALGVVGLATAIVTAGEDRTHQVQRRQITFAGNVLHAVISPDGRYVSYTAQDTTDQVLIVQEIDGGIPDTLGRFPFVMTLEFSPDGERLLAGLKRRAVIVPRAGGPVRGLAAGRDRSCQVRAHWLPDNRHVSIHCSVDRQIVIIDLEAGGAVAIPVRDSTSWLLDGSWSPDGETFAMLTQGRDSVRWAIRAFRRVDGHVLTVFADTVPLAAPHWSPSGDAVHFARGRGDIVRVPFSWRAGPADHAPEVLHRELASISSQLSPMSIASASALAGHASVSRDGRRTVYVSGRRYSNILLIEPRHDQPAIDSLTRGTSLHGSPVVSPDGEWVAYWRSDTDGVELYQVSVRGGAVTQLTRGARVWPGTRIAWSPGGDQLAYVSVRSGVARIWVADVTSGSTQALAPTSVGVVTGHLTWAPSSYIAFQQSDHRNIRLVHPISGDHRALLAAGEPGFLFSPQFAPDGNRLAAWWNRGPGKEGVWMFDITSGARSQLHQGSTWPIGWTPDGRHVYAGSRHLVRIDMRGAGRPGAVLTVPSRESDCTLAGRTRPNAFVCASYAFVSDAWILEEPVDQDPS